VPLARLRSVLLALVHRRRFEEGMSEEMRFHLARYAEDLVSRGVPPAEAERLARKEFGSVDAARADCREARGLRVIDDLGRDVRHAARRLRRSPVFTLTAVGTMALCLGANLAIFAVVDSVLLRKLPFPEGDRLVGVFNTYPRAGVPDDGISITNYYERRGHIPAFQSLAIHRETTAIVGEPGATAREHICLVSPEFFATLGIGPVKGRGFTEAETSYESDHIVVLTDGFWRERLAADEGAIGRTLRVNGTTATVIGILPPTFSFLSSKARLYFPYSSSPEQRGPDRRHWGSAGRMIARLAPGATLAQAQAQIDAHNAAMEAGDPRAKAMAEAGFRSLVVPLHDHHVAQVRPTVWLMQAGAALLLLMGAVNLVNLLLIRASAQVRDVVVRQAIGASRRHVVGQVLAETTALTTVGGLLGILTGALGIRLLVWLGADQLPLGASITLDAPLAAMTMAAAIATGVAIGLPVVWFDLRAHIAHALRGDSRATTAGALVQRVRHVFLVAQMALAFVLLVGAGLLAQSLREAMSVPPGFRPQHVLAGQVSLPGESYKDASAALAFTERLMGALQEQPGIAAAGFATHVPLDGWSGKSAATVKGRLRPPNESPHGHYSYSVGGDYFAAMGFTLREGRFLTGEDSRRGQRVCVVDDDFARYYWPRGGAIGQQLFEGSPAQAPEEAYTIVGVVGSARQAELTDEAAQGAVYYPYGRRPEGSFFVVARGTPESGALGAVLQDVVRRLDPDLPVTDLESMDGRIADSLIARRSPALLAVAFAALAVLLTAIGTYGVLSYAVAQRRREIGLRIALGANAGDVRGQFLSLALRLLAPGLGVGWAGAWLAGRAMRTLLFHVPPGHVAILGGTAAIMTGVCLLACLVPADRASRISPMEALADQ
jgi:predicted permease